MFTPIQLLAIFMIQCTALCGLLHAWIFEYIRPRFQRRFGTYVHLSQRAGVNKVKGTLKRGVYAVSNGVILKSFNRGRATRLHPTPFSARSVWFSNPFSSTFFGNITLHSRDVGPIKVGDNGEWGRWHGGEPTERSDSREGCAALQPDRNRRRCCRHTKSAV